MRRHPWLQAVLGVLLLALAAGVLMIERGTADAASSFRQRQAVWQNGLEPARSASPGIAQRVGEALLGIRSSSNVLRAYQEYRAGLADVIPGTTYPQTRARFEAVQKLERLRRSLRTSADRASADIVIGVVLAGSASTAGPQRASQLDSALAAFGRAVREDPANATAKLDLEVLLRATAPRPKGKPRPSGSPGQPHKGGSPRNPTVPATVEGTGF